MSDFSKRRRSPDGRQSYCKTCHAAWCRRYYADSPSVKESLRRNNAAARERNRTFIAEYLRTRACVDCGISDPIVLEFDHVRGQKHGDIAVFVRYPVSLERLVTEIEKCDVRCANCHRRRSALRWTRSGRSREQDFSLLISYR